MDGGKAVKNGKTKNEKQRYKCKCCGKSFINSYTYKAYQPTIDDWIIALVKESAGIRSIARLLDISPKTVISKIVKISSRIKKPLIPLGAKFEVDELWTYIGKKTKRRYICYSLSRDTKDVLGFSVGTRSKKHLRKVTDSLVLAKAKTIYTDRLKEYGNIIPKSMHKTTKYGTNHIERMNTTLRCHMKRLNRKTIAYSKRLTMLNACLTLYFWG